MRTLPPPARSAALAATALLLAAAPLRAQLLISEFMASNVSVTQDEDAAYSDWIEIHNPGASPVDLSGWHLTDSPTNLALWTFPATTLPPDGFLLVFASGKDRTSPRLHTSFSLSANGEFLALVRPDGATVEHAYTNYPPQFPNISYGLQTQGPNPTLRAGQPGFLIRHTPAAPNSCLPAPHPLYSDDSIAQIDLAISDSGWNTLMNDPWNESFQSATVRFRHGDIDLTVTNVGIQCRGNTSREQQPRSFNIAFNAFVPGQKLLDLERLNLNANVNDPSMARSKLVNDLHNAAGLPTSYANHVALVVSNSTYHYAYFDAVRDNTQPVDDVFLQQRFGTARGNLYKCLYPQGGNPATLAYLGPTGSAYRAQSSTYDLRYCGSGNDSFDDLAGFISQINQTSDADFPNTIMTVFDVDGFLQNLALDALTGHWDDYWYNGNNYHLFLNPETRRWTYLPYDFDNTFDIRWLGDDWAHQNVFSWTSTSGSHPDAPLASRILNVLEFKKRYAFYMKQILDSRFSYASLSAAAFHSRSNLVAALPFPDSVSIPDMKSEERDNYQEYWPFWIYSKFEGSYSSPQYEWNSNVPDMTGLLPFVSARAASARSQLGSVADIAPILSDFSMSPSLPRTNDAVTVSIHAFDDTAVTNVSFSYSFQGGPTNSVEMTPQPDGSYAASLPPFASTGSVRYLVRARDTAGKSTFHPYGGSAYAASVVIGSAAFDLVLSELNYNPHDLSPRETAAGLSDKETLEFVELLNAGTAPMDLTGFKLQNGVTATFPSFVLDAGSHAVVVANSNAFRIRYTNPAIRVIGTYTGNLKNSGETIRLENASGGVIASLTWSDSGDWPGRADGDGSSLELVDPASPDYANPLAWRSSSEYGGSPGAAGLGPDERVVVNEVLTHTDPPLSDSVELLNVTEAALDIGGWFLSDAKSNYRKFRIPPGTLLPAGAYLVFDESHFNASGDTNLDFSLDGAHGDDVYLLQADAQSNLVRFADHVEFGAAANGESFGRWPNGSGAGFPMLSRTFGSANSGPRVGPVVLSEIMYAPPSGSNHLEFIEIANPAPDQAMVLTRCLLDGAVSYAFPTGAVLAGQSALAILPFDPAAPSNSALLASFRSTYVLSTNVPLLGPYSGALDNGGERIRLLCPDEPPAEEPAYYPMLILDEAEYGNDLPWPPAANAGGASLERILPAAWGDDPASWIAADPPSPGAAGEPIATFQLTVASDHGNPTPSVGPHAFPPLTLLSNSVPSPVVSANHRYLCAGWSLSPHDPASGASNSMTMTLTNDATLTWLWSTQFLLSVSSSPGGSALPPSGWQAPASLVELVASPSNLFAFTRWSGDTNAIASGTPTSATISVRMDAPVSLSALFDELPVPSNTLTIASAHGSPSPPVGPHAFRTGAILTNSVPSPVVSDSLQFLCAGWSLSPHEPASGASSSMTMSLTNDATLTWLWSTNFLLSLSSDPGGAVLPSTGWHDPAAIVELVASPSNLFAFAGWSGDTSAIVSGDPSSPAISVRMDSPLSLHAAFEAVVATYYVSPSGSHTPPYTNWASASTSLHAIVSYVPNASTILVAAATYPLPSQLSLGKPIHLISADGPATTVLDGRSAARVLFLSHSNAIVEGFTIQNGDSGSSSGGGARIEPAGSLLNCVLRHNASQKYGGGAALLGGGELRNCLLHANSAGEWGGGLYTFSSAFAPLVGSCTLASNSANEGGGAYLNGPASLLDSIAWENSASSGSNLFLSGYGQTFQSCLTNLSPRFANPAAADFRLSPDSPAIDAATLRPWMTNALDLDSHPRVLYGVPDIGAYEGLLDSIDSDGDHVRDWQESLAGTDPFDPASVLGIASASLDPLPGQFVLSWSSAAGRSYRIARGAALLDSPFSPAYSNIPAAPPLNTFTGALDPSASSFYRIELE